MPSIMKRCAGPVFAGLLSLAAISVAQAQNSVVLENLTVPGEDASVLTLGRVEVADTNLTREEVASLFAKDADRAATSALLARMTASRILVEKASVTSKTARVTIQPLRIDNVRAGRFEKLTLDGLSGDTSDEKGGSSTFTSRAIELTNGDFAAALSAAREGKDASGLSQVETVKWDGIDVTFRQPDLPAADRGNEGTVSVASIRFAMQPDCAARCQATAAVSGIVFTPPPAAEGAKQLKAFGFDKLQFNLQGRSSYEGGTRRLVLEENTVSEAQAGDLKISGVLENVDQDAIKPVGRDRRMAALVGASISEINLAFENRKLVDAAFAYAAQARGATPEALKAQASATAAQILPLFLGGDPSSLDMAQSVQTFIKDPRNFTLRMKARGAPVPIARLSAIRDPASFLALVDLRLEVNK